MKFNVGDTVKIIKDITGQGKGVGSIGTIIEEYRTGKYPYLVMLPDNNDYPLLDAAAEELELLPTENTMVRKRGENTMQNNFKVGDILEPINKSVYNGCSSGTSAIKNGEAFYIEVLATQSDGFIKGRFLDASRKSIGFTSCCWMRSKYFQKVSSATNLMQKLNIITRKIVDADTRKFVKAGFLDSCLNLTDEGKEAIFVIWMMQPANKKLLSDEADSTIEEKEEEEKKNK